MASDNVVFLAFDNPNIVPKSDRVLGVCKFCKNKTFLLVHDDSSFPLLQCTACLTAIGRIGWVPPEGLTP